MRFIVDTVCVSLVFVFSLSSFFSLMMYVSVLRPARNFLHLDLDLHPDFTEGETLLALYQQQKQLANSNAIALEIGRSPTSLINANLTFTATI
jgi:hypothetical protein